VKRTQHTVLVEQTSPGVLLLTLNDPSLPNILTHQLTTRWTEVVDEITRDSSVRAVVLTGVGDAFCVGADLSWIEDEDRSTATPDRIRSRLLPFYRAWLAPLTMSVPTVAAINGDAFGAGLCLALACDLRYAAPSARFSAPFVTVGTHAGMGITRLLPDAVGVTRAREMIYLGTELDAETAVTWGLINAVAHDVVAHSVSVAESIAAAAPIAVRLSKAGLTQGEHGLEAALQWEGLAQPVTMSTEDLLEGIASRQEGRPPRFVGR
jgi:enoyl-CoA hydratase